jgi:hypothetical protein
LIAVEVKSFLDPSLVSDFHMGAILIVRDRRG